MRRGPVVLLAGPTASGKSALAIGLAQAVGGTVINADSMQVYGELRVLTARPSPAEESLVPHRLYGTLKAAEPCSAARWRTLAVAEIDAAHRAGRVPLLVGGTGLYFRALIDGLAPVPAVPAAIRARARHLHAEIGGAAFKSMLAERDRRGAERLHAGDSQRLIRAWEVIEATGRSLSDWQAHAPAATLDAPVLTVMITPDRAALYAACDRRFAAMLANGALDEVAALDALGLDDQLPVMKALGLPALRRHLQGALSRDQATRAAQQATRNFAKRQLTWFRHQMRAQVTLSDPRRGAEGLADSVRRFVLTAH
ncbi:MAG: tRNA (adenosine(37)-N6)-dimethylallyltransferase MiaA [Alphaproteobacteria bacterium]|jgi:tRNA dimethylallyltransferase|nr:tRNA (adenosine(37)-N6)-dimethylallyltransferase MiaA [Alphaproteobacteria bacterium]MDP6516203.1 tRNA (adenosine(37)-N6)-dimethylallyltransferase MiaA [Alphaproteobacteria bacterium]